MTAPSPTYAITGGARIGFVNFSWPLATLSVTADRLTISTTMFGLFGMGTYSFGKAEILSIESYGRFSFFSQGIRITHSVANYPRKIIFWSNPQAALAGIASVGFAPGGSGGPPVLPHERPATGFPLRWWPVVVLAVVWNALFLLVSSFLSRSPSVFAPSILAAVGIFFTLSLAALFSPAVQTVFMKPGRHFGEVRNAFILTAFVTGIMTAVFGIGLVASWLKHGAAVPTLHP